MVRLGDLIDDVSANEPHDDEPPTIYQTAAGAFRVEGSDSYKLIIPLNGAPSLPFRSYETVRSHVAHAGVLVGRKLYTMGARGLVETFNDEFEQMACGCELVMTPTGVLFFHKTVKRWNFDTFEDLGWEGLFSVTPHGQLSTRLRLADLDIERILQDDGTWLDTRDAIYAADGHGWPALEGLRQLCYPYALTSTALWAMDRGEFVPYETNAGEPLRLPEFPVLCRAHGQVWLASLSAFVTPAALDYFERREARKRFKDA